jgi:hypothetical protein
MDSMEFSEALTQTKSEFESWRSQRKGRKAIPEGLWRKAIELAKRSGSCGPVAKELRLNSFALRQKALSYGIVIGRSRLKKESNDRSRKLEVTQIVPLEIESAPLASLEVNCVSVAGHRMQIKNAQPRDVHAMFSLMFGVVQ